MKLFTILFALLFLGTTTMAQNSIIYKRNPATGVLEVYESQNGFPVGQRIGEIKENPVSGYVEITNYQKDKIIVEKESPYSRKPNYSVQEFTPYSLPYQSIINQIEALNRRHEYQLLENVPLKKTPNPKIEELKEAFRSETNFADNFINFYNSLTTFPLKLKDGFYNTAEVGEPYMSKILNMRQRTYQTGIAKVYEGNIVEYYENIYPDKYSTTSNVYRKYNLKKPTEINNCKSLIYEPGSSIRQIYFLENLINSSTQIPNPNFGFYSFYTDGLYASNDKIELLHRIGRDLGREINFEDVKIIGNSGELVYLTITSAANKSYQSSCNTSNITFAFRPNKGKYSLSVSILDEENPAKMKSWWKVDNITITPNSCGSTVLKN